ncbi:methyltransferase domain-containing protein [Rouxiella sp. S1S-2]|uniref:class I SAM-dependent methyltransferase n=1 Tax=Rouxiella sp. S1S-2 TaxID=2653856 RepID=UPI0012644D4A|nr:class I SAM-dependent methyltransferase [Rouxiella sp. S1S-2]KAB7895566.1 methyltransferase domain-containing protein [Rouxiella sp. S1S-2]
MKSAHIRKKLVVPSSWDDIPRGDYYRAALEEQLQPWWSKLYGFHLLKIGNLSTEINSEDCTISHQVNVAPEGEKVHVRGDPYSLPFEQKSVDACLLCHTLNYATDPHRILREVDRVLIDDGWLVISGFAPLSVLGIGKCIPFLRKRQPFSSRMFSQTRLIDWLSLLNYEVMFKSRFQVLPWHKQGGRMISTHLPALGCMTVIVARKRTLPLQPTAKKMPARRQSIAQPVGANKSYRKEHDD